MKIVLTGGGTGGHITPLLAVAKELKSLRPDIELVAICEKHSAFVHLLESEPAISEVYQIRAGKLRRYGGQSKLKTITDVRTNVWNVRDGFYTVAGLTQAWQLLKRIRPDGIFIKGGFVGVPVGVAAHRLGIPFITHDSDTTPGLANRLIARWAKIHATGMPAELYPYTASKTVFTGIPIRSDYGPVSKEEKHVFREAAGLGHCKEVIIVTGGSQGAASINKAFSAIAPRLMQQRKGLGIIHVTGVKNEALMARHYADELLADEQRRLVVKGFSTELHTLSAAADIVVTRASATTLAEFGTQGLACIVVPGDLAGGHQAINAKHLAAADAAVVVPDGEQEALYAAVTELLDNAARRRELAKQLANMTKRNAAGELAKLLIGTFVTEVGYAATAKD